MRDHLHGVAEVFAAPLARAEIGGTVGDIESQPFIESARQIRSGGGRTNVFFGARVARAVHGRVAEDRAHAARIRPDALVLRGDRPVTEANKRKIALMCDVDEDAVVNAINVLDLRHPDDAQRAGPRRVHRRRARS
ncbi:hypothetical protein [Microbacterium paulum]